MCMCAADIERNTFSYLNAFENAAVLQRRQKETRVYENRFRSIVRNVDGPAVGRTFRTKFSRSDRIRSYERVNV